MPSAAPVGRKKEKGAHVYIAAFTIRAGSPFVSFYLSFPSDLLFFSLLLCCREIVRRRTFIRATSRRVAPRHAAHECRR